MRIIGYCVNSEMQYEGHSTGHINGCIVRGGLYLDPSCYKRGKRKEEREMGEIRRKRKNHENTESVFLILDAYTERLHRVLLTAATAKMHCWVAQDVAVKKH